MFNVIKCYKVKKTHITKVSNHTHRTKLTEAEQNRIRHNLTPQNRILVGSNVAADVRNRIKHYATNKTRKDAVYAEHYVISASPEFFNTGQTEDWIKEQVIFLKNEFGANLTTAVLHCDETTLHIEAFVTPIIKNPKTQKMELNRKAFNATRGGLNSFTQLQNRHAAHNKKFGLLRGVSKDISKVKADDLEEYYKAAEQYKNALKGYKPPSIDNLMPQKSWGIYKPEDIKMALKKALIINSKVFKKALAAVEYYKTMCKKLIKQTNILIYKNNKLKEELEDLKTNADKIIKQQKDILKEFKPLADIGYKVVDLNLEQDINKRYELKYTSKPEQTQTSENKKQNKLKI